MRENLLFHTATTATGKAFAMRGDTATVQATIVGSGAVSATVYIDVSNDGENWIALDTPISLSGTGSSTNGLAIGAHWEFVRARLTAVSGGRVTVVIGS